MGEVEVRALVGVDLDVSERELVVILGPSGSGKSTLLHMLGGMDSPTSGTILFRGRDIGALGSDERTLFRRRHVGFVFQFYNLVPSLTALENVEMATEIGSSPRDPRAMLERVGLGARADHFPSQLSGGEQQRVAIARAVAKGAEVLLCDEPTGALDHATGHLVLTLLRDVRDEFGATVLLITHNASIGAMGDLVVRMRDGRIAETTRNAAPVPPEEIDW
jgi:putative ABC transport system ATP-binding protein